MPDAHLTTPGHYGRTKTTTLLSYFASASSSHYHWAYDLIRKGLKTRKPQTTSAD